MIEIYCDSCGNKLGDFDYDATKPHPVYVPACQKCLDAIKVIETQGHIES